MFEIGNSLHEARVRQGLALPAIEAATKIRAKYLKALEEEQFDLLPAQTYVKGFLRTYADHLGLDGQLYVDEYSSRFVVGEDDGRQLRPRRSSARPPRRAGFESSVVLVTLAAIGLVAALVIVAWKSGGSNRVQQLDNAPAVQTPAARRPAVVKPTSAHLVVVAKRGNSLLEVHAGSPAGRLLFQGTLLRGKSVALDGKRLWLGLGTPRNLDATLNGHSVRLRGASVVVTAAGVQSG
jgi:hypothetical protein